MSIYYFSVSLRMIILRLMHGLIVSEIENKYFVLIMPLINQDCVDRKRPIILLFEDGFVLKK